MTARIVLFVAILGLSVPIFGQKPTGVIVNVNAASYAQPTLARGSIVAAFGRNLSKEVVVGHDPILDGTQVFLEAADGLVLVAPLLFVSPGQVNYQIPSEIAKGVTRVELRNRQGESHVGYIEIVDGAPGLFTQEINGEPIAKALMFGWGESFRCDSSGCHVQELAFNVRGFLLLQATGFKHCPAGQRRLLISGLRVGMIEINDEGFGVDSIVWLYTYVNYPPQWHGRTIVQVACGDLLSQPAVLYFR